MGVAHSSVHTGRGEKKEKKPRKSPNKTTVHANMGENPAPQPGQHKEVSRQTLDILHIRLFFTATGQANTPR